MRIAFCLGSLNKGGAERVVCNLANYLVERNNEVTIIVTKLDKIEYELNKNVKVISLDDKNKKSRNILSRNIKRIQYLKKIILDLKCDIVLSFLQEPTGRLLILKTFDRKIKKIPIIVSMRIDPKHAFNSFKRKLMLPLYNKSEGFVFQTQEAKRFFNKKIQSRSLVIPNPLNMDFYNKKVTKKEREKKIVSVGRLTSQKNYPMLINSFKNIEKKFPEYTLEIYGDGELKEELTSLIKNLNLEKKVFLKGNVTNLKERIENASLFVMTSDYEGLSNALMESLALGLPSISTDSDGGGARELINDGFNGILVEKNDIIDLSKKIEYVLNNKKHSEYLAKNAIESMKKYNPDEINKRWEDYINNIYRR